MRCSGPANVKDVDASEEIEAGERFAFGDNWTSFLALVDEDRIQAASAALREMLGVTDLVGRRFLDAGSGSGLSSLAAHRLGADVVSFDFDPASVACTAELRTRYGGDRRWEVLEGSVLDAAFLSALGQFDVVYSWGVLHHTGDMWTALENVGPLVRPGGQLFVAIYNDQGSTSRRWTAIKRRYVNGSPATKRLLEVATQSYFSARSGAGTALRALTRGDRTPSAPRPRGMDRRRDLVDWVGGYPFEVARPEEIFSFYRDRGFVLDRLRTCGGGLGCNELVLSRAVERQ